MFFSYKPTLKVITVTTSTLTDSNLTDNDFPRFKDKLPNRIRSRNSKNGTLTVFYTEEGYLTPYGLACGYIENDFNKGIDTCLWKEHGKYHVRQHDFNKGQRISWEVFDYLSAARPYFLKLVIDPNQGELFNTPVGAEV